MPIRAKRQGAANDPGVTSDFAFALVYDRSQLREEPHMKEFFNFDNFAFTFTIGLIIFSWLAFLSVIFFG